MFDRTLVEMAERHATEDEVSTYLHGMVGDQYACTCGWEDIKIEWLFSGTSFRITEYDGSESIEYLSRVDWSIA